MRPQSLIALAVILGWTFAGCDSSQTESVPEDPSAMQSLPDTPVLPAESDDTAAESSSAATDPSNTTVESGAQSEKSTAQESATGKPSESPDRDAERNDSEPADTLPDTTLSNEASDLSVDPVYVDPRKHEPVFDVTPGWLKLAKDYPLWIDREAKQVIVDGRIAQVQAALEMFACPVDSGKEHESVVGLYCDSEMIHAALLAVGAKPGHPVIFQPEFQPPEGTEVAIEVIWEKDGKPQTIDARQWIRSMDTKEVLKTNWVFGGSEFYVDDRSGQRYYLANGGETVCVSNFSTAMLDLPVESSANAANQLFEANTDKIPPLGTPVRLIFKPQIEATTESDGNQQESAEPGNSDSDGQKEAETSETDQNTGSDT